jgi:hypothetical protein
VRPGHLLDHGAQGFRRHHHQGEGAAEENPNSHYCRFLAIRKELAALKGANPSFQPAHPAAVNPVLRRPVRTGVRVWLENEEAAATVDIANTAYMLMLPAARRTRT